MHGFVCVSTKKGNSVGVCVCVRDDGGRGVGWQRGKQKVGMEGEGQNL